MRESFWFAGSFMLCFRHEYGPYILLQHLAKVGIEIIGGSGRRASVPTCASGLLCMYIAFVSAASHGQWESPNSSYAKAGGPQSCRYCAHFHVRPLLASRVCFWIWVAIAKAPSGATKNTPTNNPTKNTTKILENKKIRATSKNQKITPGNNGETHTSA